MCQSKLTEFLAELTVFAAELSELSLPETALSQNSIPPVPYLRVSEILKEHLSDLEISLRDFAKNVAVRDLLARGNHPNFEKTLREFGLKFWRPSNSESRSENCSENRVFT